ncbi:hypothetical protein HDU87_006158 [Geranomyces variabilis]|uniref:Peptidase S8/S53 domain-containing protein n=1 Tax=Geranomyces variabilis TaxID=109894 RepID=A0AAD5TG98_9FUNG|nr:hypothetical protein HDU87_006158 [Geranomyces variabilis]
MPAKTLLALTLLSSTAALAAAAAAPLPANFATQVSALSETDQISFTVRLRDSLALKPADVPKSLTADRAAQGAFVHSTLTKHAEKTQRGVKDILKAAGDKVSFVKSYAVANVIVVDATRDVLEAVRAHPDVAEVKSNAAFKVIDKPAAVVKENGFAAAATAPQWNLAQVHAPEVWAKGFTGGNLTYGHADTGVQWDHPEIKSAYLGTKANRKVDHNYAWFDGVRRAIAASNPYCQPMGVAPCDDNGHGSHTASTAVGRNVGVAPGARLMACRNMDNGEGRPETYLNCMEFFLAPTDVAGNNPDPSRRPHAIGNSWGCPAEEQCDASTFDDALANLRAAGIFMSVSAGNDAETSGCNSVDAPPATSAIVTSVAAVDRSRGVDISAPGVAVRAAWRGTGYNTIDGTSMASPHIGGAVMLISHACPKLQHDVANISSLLYQTATPLFTTRSNGCSGDTRKNTPNSVYGYGQVNVLAAINKCTAAAARA